MGKPKFYGAARGAPAVRHLGRGACAGGRHQGRGHKSFSTREEAARWVSAKSRHLRDDDDGRGAAERGAQDRASARSPRRRRASPGTAERELDGRRARATSARDGGDLIAAAEGANEK